MNEPKLHHYVPRFYLENFSDKKSQLWVYDKIKDKIFQTAPKNIAAEKDFYRLPDLLIGENDPLTIEKNLSSLEANASRIIARIKSEAELLTSLDKLELSDDDRKIISEFVSIQYFRTLEFKDLLLFLIEETDTSTDKLSEAAQKALYFRILSDSGFIEEMAESIYSAIWIFAKNKTDTPFITSDHPVVVTTFDNKQWIKSVDPLTNGSYVSFPISPAIILYCKEFTYWNKLKKFDLNISPVTLDAKMVGHENCGQAFMASRFLISGINDFKEVRDFIPSIGTNIYASDVVTDDPAIERTSVFNSIRRSKFK